MEGRTAQLVRKQELLKSSEGTGQSQIAVCLVPGFERKGFAVGQFQLAGWENSAD